MSKQFFNTDLFSAESKNIEEKRIVIRECRSSIQPEMVRFVSPNIKDPFVLDITRHGVNDKLKILGFTVFNPLSSLFIV